MAEGTKSEPSILTTLPGTSQCTMYRDEDADPAILVCQVGTTTLEYWWRAIEDLHVWLVEHGEWVLLGSADESKAVVEGTVEAWGRSSSVFRGLLSVCSGLWTSTV